MLLCVGSFFSSTEECQQQWSNYLGGKEIGRYLLTELLSRDIYMCM